MGMAKEQTALLETIRSPDFDVSSFVRDATGQGSERVTRITQQLEECVSIIEEDLNREIIACHEELLQNASSLSCLDGQLGDLREVVQGLKNSMKRVKNDVLVPFQGIKHRTALVERIESANVLIRKLRLFLFDVRKLHAQMETPAKDLAKAAHTLQELEQSIADGSLERVEILKKEVDWIRETGTKIRQQATNDLRNGVRQGNQVTTGVALQVFFNLQSLWPQLRRLLSELLEEFSQVALPTGSGFQSGFETNLQVLAAQTQRIYVLDEVIKSKTDSLTQKSFSSLLDEEGVGLLVGRYWSDATSRLKAKFTRVFQDKSFRKTLLAECPKLLKALTETFEKVNQTSRGKGVILKSPDRDALIASLGDVRNEFLGESIKRVTEPVEMMLPDKLLSNRSSNERGSHDSSLADDLPTSHDLKRYVQLLVSELERCEGSPELLLKDVIRAARSSIMFFSTRLEQVVDNAAVDLRCFEDLASLKLKTPTPMPSAGHARNARLYGIAHHTLSALKDVVPPRFQSAICTPQVHGTLQQIQAVIVNQMFSTLKQAALTAFQNLEIGTSRTAEGAPFVLSFSTACSHVGRYYFSLFGQGQLFPHIKELCIHIVRTFLSSAALIKPCGANEKQEIMQDMQSVENALCALDTDFQNSIRHEASVFREFRRLICAPNLEALDFDSLATVMPVHLLLTFLAHQLPADVPSLPAVAKASPQTFLQSTLLPLWEDSSEERLQSYRKLLGALSDEAELDSENAVAAYVMSQMY